MSPSSARFLAEGPISWFEVVLSGTGDIRVCKGLRWKLEGGELREDIVDTNVYKLYMELGAQGYRGTG